MACPVQDTASVTPTRKDPKSFQHDIIARGHKVVDTIDVDITEEMLEPMAKGGADLIGKWIAYKWNQKKQGGWMAGRITKQTEGGANDDKCNFICTWADGWEFSVPVLHENMADARFMDGDFGRCSWLLITDPNADDDVSALAKKGQLRPPQKPDSKSGPKQNKRAGG